MNQNLQRYEFSHRELVAAMVKAKNIHDGLWGLEVKFNWNAVSFDYGNGLVQPTSLVGIQSLSIARVEALTPLAVDASVVNPRSMIVNPFEVAKH